MKGEIKSLALQFGWGGDKLTKIDDLLAQLPAADISSEVVISAYASIDAKSRAMGRDLGKNDAWIAAIVSVQRAVLLTTDKDFGHLHPEVVEVEYVDPEQLAAGAI